MTSKYESADLILKLYELRREETMRTARTWFAREFFPESADDVRAASAGPQSAYFRMVTSYWDMATSFVENGAIDADMFNAANNEHNLVYAKMEPFLEEIRRTMPAYLKHLESVVMAQPDAAERVERLRSLMKTWAKPAAESQTN